MNRRPTPASRPPLTSGAMKDRLVEELAVVHRLNRFEPDFIDASTGGLYEHKLAERLDVSLTGGRGPDTGDEAEVFWRVLDTLQKEGVTRRNVRMPGFPFRGVRLTDDGLRRAVRSGYLQPGWETPEDELLIAAPNPALPPITPLDFDRYVRDFVSEGRDSGDALEAPPRNLPNLLVARACRRLVWATEGRNLGEGNVPATNAPDWLFPHAHVAFEFAQLSPRSRPVDTALAGRWATTLREALRPLAPRLRHRALVIAGTLPASPRERAARRLETEIASLMEQPGILLPRLTPPGLYERRRLRLPLDSSSRLRTEGIRQVEVHFPVPAAPRWPDEPLFVIVESGVAEGSDLHQSARDRLATKPPRATLAREALPAGWQLALGLWLDDFPGERGSLAARERQLVATQGFEAVVAAFDAVYLFWAPAGLGVLSLDGPNLLRLKPRGPAGVVSTTKELRT